MNLIFLITINFYSILYTKKVHYYQMQRKVTRQLVNYYEYKLMRDSLDALEFKDKVVLNFVRKFVG